MAVELILLPSAIFTLRGLVATTGISRFCSKEGFMKEWVLPESMKAQMGT